jgi:hypothetical protein
MNTIYGLVIYKSKTTNSTNQLNNLAILHLHMTGTWPMRPINDQVSELLRVLLGDRDGESQFACENGRNSDLVRFNIYVWRDYGTSCMIDAFSLKVVTN